MVVVVVVVGVVWSALGLADALKIDTSGGQCIVVVVLLLNCCLLLVTAAAAAANEPYVDWRRWHSNTTDGCTRAGGGGPPPTVLYPRRRCAFDVTAASRTSNGWLILASGNFFLGFLLPKEGPIAEPMVG